MWYWYDQLVGQKDDVFWGIQNNRICDWDKLSLYGASSILIVLF